jgi:hypothetical protein
LVADLSLDKKMLQDVVQGRPLASAQQEPWGYENQVELVQLPDGKFVNTPYNADNRRVQKLT